MSMFVMKPSFRWMGDGSVCTWYVAAN